MSERRPAPGSPEPGPWDHAYRSHSAPWDVGHPQPVFQRLAAEGAISAPVLDSGCGSGENALFLASLGHEVTGVDFSPLAIDIARRKAAAAGSTASFQVHDVLELGSLGRAFATVIDSGVFHVFEDADRARYVESLRAVLGPGAQLLLLCFSDAQPGADGPRRVSEDELRGAFADGWTVASIEPAMFDVGPPIGPARAWLARIVRGKG